MSPPCHQAIRRRHVGRVVDLERVRVEQLADEIAAQLRHGGGSVCRLTADVDDIARCGGPPDGLGGCSASRSAPVSRTTA